MGAGNVVKTLIAKDFILTLKCTRKRLVARLRLDPLGEHGRFFRVPNRNWRPGMEHSLAAVRGAVWVTGKSKVRRFGKMGRDDMEGGDGKMFSNPSLPDNSFSAQNAPKRLAARLRPDPLGELMRNSAGGAVAGNTLHLCILCIYCAIYNSEIVFALLLFFACA